MRTRHKTITWPTAPFFTIRDLHRLNPRFVEITLRVRFTKNIEGGTVAEIGSLNGGKGRPEKVFTFTPVTGEKIRQAVAQKINLADGFLAITVEQAKEAA
ncbi:MAG: hypothetical protein AB9869_23140 [Verrucomicrobiia bacterium]